MSTEPRKDASARGLSTDELAAELATDLPEREALSIVDPGVFSVFPMPIGRTADVPPAQPAAADELPPPAA
jgi:hypothetical protein